MIDVRDIVTAADVDDYAKKRGCIVTYSFDGYKQIVEILVSKGSRDISYTHSGSMAPSVIVPIVLRLIDTICSDDDVIKYCENDVKITKELYSIMTRTYANGQVIPKIKNVIFNDPATIVFWGDGTKTVVKCQDDDWYDPEKGLAMAISKKALGNKGNYCNEIKKWLPKEEASDVQELTVIGNVKSIITNGTGATFSCELSKEASESFKKAFDTFTIPEITFEAKKATEEPDPIHKAYDILVKIAKDSNDNHRDYQVPMDDIDAVIGYLVEALGD